MKRTVDLRLYLVTDPGLLSWDRLEPMLESLVELGGISAVQLRDKTATTHELVDRARRMKRILEPRGVPLFVNDRVDVALAAHADGVHVGQSDLPVREARRIIGPHVMLGVSIESLDQVGPAVAAGADYLAVSPVYGTPTKADAGAPLGLEGIRAVRAQTDLPVVGIGGMNRDSTREVIRAGADGVAVISAILDDENPVEAAARIALEVSAGLSERRPIKNALTVAGSDSGGGAGIQADLKTFSALGIYGASVITALTAQNTRGVSAIHDVPAAFVTAQLDAVMTDLDVEAVKIGMLSQVSVIEAVAAAIDRYRPRHVVLDPVMVAKSGDRLLSADAVEALVTRLLPRATIVTPNLPEAGVLLGRPTPASLADMEEAARDLAGGGPAVLMKGGHLEGPVSTDVLQARGQPRHFSAPRIDTRNTHGTGCTLSSAIAAFLCHGHSLPEAVFAAKRYVAQGIREASRLNVGSGHGPVHHFAKPWKDLPFGEVLATPR